MHHIEAFQCHPTEQNKYYVGWEDAKSVPFTFKRMSIPEVILVEPKAFNDERGYFVEIYKESNFAELGIDTQFVQDNLSRSVKGTLRGLHYQLNPEAQAKLVFAIRGTIFDVAVDVRKNSPTYGQWVGEVISDGNHRGLFVPEGFAHGFCVMSDEADVFYKVTKEYSAGHERGVIWNDAGIMIKWPTGSPTLSAKDAALPALESAEKNFEYERKTTVPKGP
jgi:dTDP-4-dehydrorhamnose 3,5-epimerase